jgi:hypothetical protein
MISLNIYWVSHLFSFWYLSLSEFLIFIKVYQNTKINLVYWKVHEAYAWTKRCICMKNKSIFCFVFNNFISHNCTYTDINVQKCKFKELRSVSGYSWVKRSRGHSLLSRLGDVIVIGFELMGSVCPFWQKGCLGLCVNNQKGHWLSF